MERHGRTKIADCADDLRRRILTLDLGPGQALDLAAISEFYDVSMARLRDMFRLLAVEGYVQPQNRQGVQVTPITQDRLLGFYAAAPVIYATVAREAALNATAAQIARLKECQWAFRQAIRSGVPAERALGNQRFHAQMGEMTGNPYLLPSLLRLLIDHTRTGMVFYAPSHVTTTEVQALATEQHDQFIALIEARAAEEAAKLALAHWDLSRSQIERFVQSDAELARLYPKSAAQK